MRDRPRPQELYRHFKGKLYQIVTLAGYEATGEEMVVYQALYGDFRVWCRPLAEFLAEVDREKYPEAKARYRFTRVEAAQVEQGQSARRSPAAPVREERSERPRAAGVMGKTIEEEAEELGLDPRVIAFLDADGAGNRLRVLEELRGNATNDMIDIMAVAAGVDIGPGEPWDRFNELRDCLRTIERFEATRLR